MLSKLSRIALVGVVIAAAVACLGPRSWDAPTNTVTIASGDNITAVCAAADNPTAITATYNDDLSLQVSCTEPANTTAPTWATPTLTVHGSSAKIRCHGTQALTYTISGVTLTPVCTGVVTTTTTTPTTDPCGSTATPPAAYRHIVVVMMENRTWSGVGGVGFGDPAMPYLHSLALKCTTFSDWTETNTSENSLTQYIGLTSGLNDPDGIANDCSPSTTCRTTADNIFRQVRISGGTARSYVEGATTGCSASGNAPRHIPALYYFGTYTQDGTAHNDHDFCAAEVRPLTELDVNNLPTYAMVTPTLCNDGHDCGNATVDSFAKLWVAKILASASYASGDTAVVVLYDEDHPVPNLIVAPNAAAGVNDTPGMSHAAMLQIWDLMLGLPLI